VNSPWPLVPLGEVLTEQKIRVGSFDADGLPLLGVKNTAGLHQSEKTRITDMSRYLRVQHRWFAYNPMPINVGSIGWAERLDQSGVISPDYVVFSCTDRVEPKLLYLFLRSPRGLRAINLETAGTVRERLYFDSLSRIHYHLPPVPEQRRILARIEELAAKINEAHTLRQHAIQEGDRLLICMAHRRDLTETAKATQGWRKLQLGEIMKRVDNSHRVAADQTFRNLGIYSFGKGLFHKPPIDGALTSALTLRRVRKGQFIYSRLFAFEGAYGFVGDEFDGYFVSNEYPTFDCHPTEARAEFVAAYFKSPAVWKEVATGSKGLGDRRQRVQPEKILSHTVWLPPMNWQNQIAQVQARVDTLKKLQAKTAAELDALLPSILDKAFKGEL
jgi:type I restriction enzyme S subunit